MDNYSYNDKKYPYNYQPPPPPNYGPPPPPSSDPYHQPPYQYSYNSPHAYPYSPSGYPPPTAESPHSSSLDYHQHRHSPSHSGALDYQYQQQSHSGPLPYPYERPAPGSATSQQSSPHNGSFQYGSPHYHHYQQPGRVHYPSLETDPQMPTQGGSFPEHHSQDRLSSLRVFAAPRHENVSDNNPSYPPVYPPLDEHLGNLHLSANNYQPSAPASPPAPSVPPVPNSPLTHQGSNLSSPGGFYAYPNNSFSSNHEGAYLGRSDSSNYPAYAHSSSFNGSQHGQNMQIVPSSKGSLKVLLLHGNLDIWIYAATNLPNMDMFHKTLGDMFGSQVSGGKITSDPYVTVSVAGAVVGRTFVISNSENPVWQQHFYVPVAHYAAEVHFSVKDSDVVGSELIGVVAIPVEQIYTGARVEGTYSIMNSSGKPCKPGATMTLSIQYTPMERLSFYHRGVGAGPDYIGVPGTYFPLRKGGTVTLYQDAHVPDGCLPHLRLDRGIPYEHGKCWYDICSAISQAQRLVYITGWSVWHKVRLVRDAGPSLNCTLGELLRSKSQEGVRVLLLVWDDPTSRSILGYKMVSNLLPCISLFHFCLSLGTVHYVCL